MNRERQSFLDHISQQPWDDGVCRLIYADWLEEHDMLEEATRQREIIPAERWLREFAHRHSDFGDRCDPTEKDIEGNYHHSYHQLLYFLKRHDGYEGFYLPFDTPYDFNDYSDELWRNFEIVTGLKAPDNVYRYEIPPFRCGC